MENDQNHAEMNQELEQITLHTLDRLLVIGAKFQDVHFLAARLGVEDMFLRGAVAQSAKH